MTVTAQDALEATLLFHSGGVWDAETAGRWNDLTGGRPATTHGLCDAVREALTCGQQRATR